MDDAPPSAYVYMVRCADGTLYTGWTTDVARRVAEHNAGRGARYTRQRGPVELVYSEAQPDRATALRREEEIKRRGRGYKERLLQDAADGQRP
jgi:putative endonuclease